MQWLVLNGGLTNLRPVKMKFSLSEGYCGLPAAWAISHCGWLWLVASAPGDAIMTGQIGCAQHHQSSNHVWRGLFHSTCFSLPSGTEICILLHLMRVGGRNKYSNEHLTSRYPHSPFHTFLCSSFVFLLFFPVFHFWIPVLDFHFRSTCNISF